MLGWDDLDNPDPTSWSELTGAGYPDHPMEYWWRVDSFYTWSAEGKCLASIYFERWYIIGHTPQGVWLDSYPSRNDPPSRKYHRWVSKHTRRRWAYPTKAEAWDSFLIRQTKRVQHASNALEVAETINNLAVRLTP